MKHTVYKISGMTCNGCKNDVEQRLLSIDDVIDAVVDLEKNEAILKTETTIDLSVLRLALPNKYNIEKQHLENNFSNNSILDATEQGKSKLRQLQPLFLILGYITIATVLLNYHRQNWNSAMFDFMGLFYIVFSFFKMLDLKGFPKSFAMYDPLAKRIPVYGWIYPFIETALGLMFLIRLQVTIALITTLIILGITTIGVTQTLLKKKTIRCACLGTALKLPMTKATFIENTIMIIMAIFMLFA